MQDYKWLYLDYLKREHRKRMKEDAKATLVILGLAALMGIVLVAFIYAYAIIFR